MLRCVLARADQFVAHRANIAPGSVREMRVPLSPCRSTRCLLFFIVSDLEVSEASVFTQFTTFSSVCLHDAKQEALQIKSLYKHISHSSGGGTATHVARSQPITTTTATTTTTEVLVVVVVVVVVVLAVTSALFGMRPASGHGESTCALSPLPMAEEHARAKVYGDEESLAEQNILACKR